MYIRPDYYKQCSDLGKSLLTKSEFPYPEYLNQECKELIAYLGNDFNLGSCLKYLWRLGNKKSIFPWINKKLILKDLKKALYYIDEFNKIYKAECVEDKAIPNAFYMFTCNLSRWLKFEIEKMY